MVVLHRVILHHANLTQLYLNRSTHDDTALFAPLHLAFYILVLIHRFAVNSLYTFHLCHEQVNDFHIYIYIYIIVEKSPNSSHMYDHGFMDNTNRQAVKNWLDSQTRDTSLTSWRQTFCKGRISCLWIKSVFDCLTIGIIHETMVVHMTWVWTFFNNYSNHPRMCVLSTLCGNVDKHSPFYIYIIYIYIYIYIYLYIYYQRFSACRLLSHFKHHS